LKWAWANEIGRTISSLIAQASPAQPWYFNTLSTGIEKVNIVALEGSYGCLSTRDNVNGTDLVFDFLLHHLSKIEDDHNYKLCHKEDSKIYKCCSVIGFGNLKLCTDYSSIALEYANEYIIAMTIITGIIVLPLILKYLRSFKKESKHYKFSDSPMALSSIFHAALIEEKGPVKSAQRRLVFSLTVTGILYVSGMESTWVVIAAVWIIPFTAFDTFVINYDLQFDVILPLIIVVLLFISGLYLNAEFYSPTVAPAMILAVYCWRCWRTFVETKYLQLKTKIYEVSVERANENSLHAEIEDDTSMPTNEACNFNTEGNHDEIDDGRFTVNIKTGTISKALYEELRETYLLYDEVLFWFLVRLFLIANFCLFVSVKMLFFQKSGISGELQIISTMAVGTLPFIFDAIWAEHTSEQKCCRHGTNANTTTSNQI
ncbi:Hypothetical predicted protein, partial [Paramuricea clavata]